MSTPRSLCYTSGDESYRSKTNASIYQKLEVAPPNVVQYSSRRVRRQMLFAGRNRHDAIILPLYLLTDVHC